MVVTFRELPVEATDVELWSGPDRDDWSRHFDILGNKALEDWQVIPRIVFDSSAWSGFLNGDNFKDLRDMPPMEELIFLTIPTYHYHQDDCLQFLDLEPGQLVFQLENRYVNIWPLDKAKYADWEDIQKNWKNGTLVSWEYMKTEFEKKLRAMETTPVDPKARFARAWRRQKINGVEIKVTFMWAEVFSLKRSWALKGMK